MALASWSSAAFWVSLGGRKDLTSLTLPGLIMQAACNNVETYCAAQVFYWVGNNGILYVLDVFVADTSSLKNRALMFAFTTSPYIVTAWVGGPAATSFLAGPGWRWAFGTFSIVVPVVATPLILLFEYNFNKAKRAGLVPVRPKHRTALESLKYYAIEFDGWPSHFLYTASANQAQLSVSFFSPVVSPSSFSHSASTPTNLSAGAPPL